MGWICIIRFRARSISPFTSKWQIVLALRFIDCLRNISWGWAFTYDKTFELDIMRQTLKQMTRYQVNRPSEKQCFRFSYIFVKQKVKCSIFIILNKVFNLSLLRQVKIPSPLWQTIWHIAVSMLSNSQMW